MGAGEGENGFSAAVVGHCFVKQYYNYLRSDPGSLYKFYGPDSQLSRSSEGAGPEATASACGHDEIHGEIMASVGGRERSACRAKIVGVDTQESLAGGLLVLVTGYLTFSQSPETRWFSQAFVLGKRTEPYPAYFVVNDVLRYAAHAPPDGPDERCELQGVEPSDQQRQVEPQLPPVLPPPRQPPVSAAAGCDAAATAGNAAGEGPCGAGGEERGGEAEDEDDEADEEDEDVEAEAEAEAEAEEEDAGEAGGAAAREEAARAGGAAAGEAAEEPAGPKEPPSWASMANKLRQGPGQLAPSKRTGFGAAAAASPKGPVLPPPGPKGPVLPPPGTSARAEAAKASAAAAAASPPATASAGGSPGAAGAAGDSRPRVWLSRLPLEVESKEVVECVSAALAEAGPQGARAVEFERKDPSKEWGYLLTSSQEAADAVLQLCKDQALTFRGRPLKAQPPQPSTPGAAAGGAPGGGLSGAPGGRARGSGRGAARAPGEAKGGEAKGGRKGGGKGGRGPAGGAQAPAEGGGAAEGAPGGSKGGGGRRGGKGGKDWRPRESAAAASP